MASGSKSAVLKLHVQSFHPVSKNICVVDAYLFSSQINCFDRKLIYGIIEFNHDHLVLLIFLWEPPLLCEKKWGNLSIGVRESCHFAISAIYKILSKVLSIKIFKKYLEASNRYLFLRTYDFYSCEVVY